MSSDRNEEIARQAEADLNSYQAKTGTEVSWGAGGHRRRLQHGHNKRIPPNEGGELDDRVKRAARTMKVKGDQSTRSSSRMEVNLDRTTDDIVAGSVPVKDRSGLPGIAAEGIEASIHNVGRNPPGPGGSQYKGADYYRPEVVPDSIAAEGNIPPSSITQASCETEGYDAEGRS
ncbi:hypothetical protein AAF712_011886 [Marasmius tenuissimus]|uniref:Uncharacterized protein n=1 Tax=Marasmius tenuissimus TaxID=585030 RepID=A0ABR2ZKQ6_9AGAR